MKSYRNPLPSFGKEGRLRDWIPKEREIGIPSLWCAFGGFLHKRKATRCRATPAKTNNYCK